MQNKIAVLTPIRKRINDLHLFVESHRNTTKGNSVIIFGIDDDDHTYDQFMKDNPEFIYEINPGMKSLPYLNFLAKKYYKEYKYLSYGEDDERFISDNWEESIISSLEEFKIGVVYPNDNLNKEALVGFPFLSSNIVEALGFMCPEKLNFLWPDYFWKKVGEEIGRIKYLPDVMIEHHHFITGKREKDEISDIVQSHGLSDMHIYNDYLANHFHADMQKIHQYIAKNSL